MDGSLAGRAFLIQAVYDVLRNIFRFSKVGTPNCPPGSARGTLVHIMSSYPRPMHLVP